jgi:hypothetical protein
MPTAKRFLGDQALHPRTDIWIVSKTTFPDTYVGERDISCTKVRQSQHFFFLLVAIPARRRDGKRRTANRFESSVLSGTWQVENC